MNVQYRNTASRVLSPANVAVTFPPQRPYVAPHIPAYMRQTYTWAYINPTSVRWLDNDFVVGAILWGQHRRLERETLTEFEPGQRVFQSAHVYGSFIPQLARRLGPQGSLDVIDIVPVQVAHCRDKLQGLSRAEVRLGNAAEDPPDGPYDAVCCYFLLHEVPGDMKRRIVNAVLGAVEPGGKAVFVDYHRPRWWHPLKWLMALVFLALEPYAPALWEREIADYADHPELSAWRKQTYFGGLYQKVVAERRD